MSEKTEGKQSAAVQSPSASSPVPARYPVFVEAMATSVSCRNEVDATWPALLFLPIKLKWSKSLSPRDNIEGAQIKGESVVV